jgi:ABC-type glycerol-3-phosphate transport system substrate-binding protein
MLRLLSILLSIVLSIAAIALFPKVASAGEIYIHNAGDRTIICNAAGNFRDTIKKNADGNTQEIALSQGATFELNPQAFPAQTIDRVECAGYNVGNLNVTPNSPDRYLSFTGQAQQTLSVLLYPYLPTTPEANFGPMVRRIVNEFQQQNPQILLDAVMTQDLAYDTYTYSNLPNLLGKNGFDLVELDTLMLGDAVDRNLILPASPEISTSKFWQVGLAASTYNDRLYGFPTWLCSYFLFGKDRDIWQVKSVPELVNYLSHKPPVKPRLIANFNSDWNAIGFYLDGYADLFGFDEVTEALAKPIDSQVMNNLVAMSAECEVNGTNGCLNNYYNEDPNAGYEDFLAGANSFIGFSENSFYIRLSDSQQLPLFATPAPYGEELQPLVFTDTLVVNSTTCSDRECQASAVKFIDYMSSVDTKLWIAFSEDLNSGTPPRRSLPAIKAFYEQPRVKQDELYPQFAPALANANANFPNSIYEDKKIAMYREICTEFKQQEAEYPNCGLLKKTLPRSKRFKGF